MAHPVNEPLFADTYFFLALLVEDDEAHANAVAWRNLDSSLVTTTWVLVEIADALSAPRARVAASRLIAFLRNDPRVKVVQPDDPIFEAGLALYSSRSDKSWSLTDCLSFEVMRRHGLTNALTGDHHFSQAGFKALMK
jgi:hypothetical protein